MSDLVVTVPLTFGLDYWIGEGDAAGDAYTGKLWDFGIGGAPPPIQKGERVYIVFNRKLRGYAPLVDLQQERPGYYYLVRGGGAVAVTIDEPIIGFRGWRKRWWDTALEKPFPDWKTP